MISEEIDPNECRWRLKTSSLTEGDIPLKSASVPNLKVLCGLVWSNGLWPL